MFKLVIEIYEYSLIIYVLTSIIKYLKKLNFFLSKCRPQGPSGIPQYSQFRSQGYPSTLSDDLWDSSVPEEKIPATQGFFLVPLKAPGFFLGR